MKLKKSLLPIGILAIGLFGAIALIPSQDSDAVSTPSTMPLAAICAAQAASLGYEIGEEVAFAPECNCPLTNCGGPGIPCQGYRDEPGGECEPVLCEPEQN